MTSLSEALTVNTTITELSLWSQPLNMEAVYLNTFLFHTQQYRQWHWTYWSHFSEWVIEEQCNTQETQSDVWVQTNKHNGVFKPVFTRLFPPPSSITWLGNCIGDKGAASMSDALTTNKALAKLNLESTKRIQTQMIPLSSSLYWVFNREWN